MPTWKCENCHSVNPSALRVCEFCGRGAGSVRAAVHAAAHLCEPNPDTGRCACGKQYNRRQDLKRLGLAIRGVLEGTVTPTQAHAEIDAVFAEVIR